MAIIQLLDIGMSFGGWPLLDQANLQIEPGERLGLIGRNGEGKSTLLKLLAGILSPDSGRIIRQPGIRITLLDQEVPSSLPGTIYEVVAEGLGATEDRPKGSESQLVESSGDWQRRPRVDAVLSRLRLQGDTPFVELSGGLKRRTLLARALVCGPDLLLLDEPTNHLDIETIAWLEDFLLKAGLTLLFVTHDRMLLRRLATRIIDLDRGRLTSWPGNYDTYLARKEAMLAVETVQAAKFDKKLAQEEVWIRQGIKARRTRNEGRVRALLELRRERQNRRNPTSKARMQLQEAESSGKLVIKAQEVCYGYGENAIIRDFSTTILRGDKIGIIGANGCGKTTLLRLLLGDLAPERGTVRLGANLLAAYFDQHRAMLDEESTVAQNLGEGHETLIVNGKPRHVIGYLQDFLFTPDRARSPVRILSGGERNRLALAKLFAQPANLLILDEPTNDLDAETLELLEELLLDFTGTILLVSHDRAFLNNVVTSTLVFEGDGRVQEYAGGYDDWLVQRQAESPVQAPKTGEKKERPRPVASGPRKLSFKERNELDGLPGHIEGMETEQRRLYEAMAEPSFYQLNGSAVAGAKARLSQLEDALIAAYARWEELERLLSK